MPQNAPALALKALTEWWDDMGVGVDQAEVRAFMSELAAREAQSVTVTSQSDSLQSSAERPLRKRTKTRTIDHWIAEAAAVAAAAPDLASLKTVIEAFGGSPLKSTCERTVVYDGAFNAQVMVIGEGPGSQEDLEGLPFVGPAGQLLDRMLAAIGLDRARNTLITNVNYWRPPNNRDPEPAELAVCRPFVERMIDLAAPKLIITAGGVAIKSLINSKVGIMRLRGTQQVLTTPAGTSVPVIPMLHPAYLLRRPQDKSRAWRDLLLVQNRLAELRVDI